MHICSPYGFTLQDPNSLHYLLGNIYYSTKIYNCHIVINNIKQWDPTEWNYMVNKYGNEFYLILKYCADDPMTVVH